MPTADDPARAADEEQGIMLRQRRLTKKRPPSDRTPTDRDRKRACRREQMRRYRQREREGKKIALAPFDEETINFLIGTGWLDPAGASIIHTANGAKISTKGWIEVAELKIRCAELRAANVELHSLLSSGNGAIIDLPNQLRDQLGVGGGGKNRTRQASERGGASAIASVAPV